MKRRFKTAVLFVLNPRFLFCFGLAWMLTNGWAYILLALGTWWNSSWMMAISGTYLALLWFPFTPEKLITVFIAMGLLRWLFPNDPKTLGILREMHAKICSGIQRHRNASQTDICIFENDNRSIITENNNSKSLKRKFFMKRMVKLRQLVIAAMFAALCCVATLIVSIPTPTNGYVHMGDTVVLLCGWLLGPIWGGIAAGLGSMLADIFSGYILYAPATLIIKGAVAILGWLIFTVFCRLFRKYSVFALILSGVIAECVMIFGYFLFEALFCGYGWGALAGIPANTVQAVFGASVGTVFMHLMERMHIRERFWLHSSIKY